MSKRFVIFLMLTSNLVMAEQVDQQKGKSCIEAQSSHGVKDISLIKLIASPKKYDGKYIRLKGVFQYGEADMGSGNLFLDRGSEENYIYHNSVGFSIDDEILTLFPDLHALTGKYMLVEGVFRARGEGIGHIDSVCRLSDLYIAYGDELDKILGIKTNKNKPVVHLEKEIKK